MIVGFNTDIKYRDEIFHIQTEDKGQSNPIVETLVYHSGEILLSRRIGYGHLMKKTDLRKRIKTIMKTQHDEVISELKGGKFMHLISMETQTLEDGSLDEMVLEFLAAQDNREAEEIPESMDDLEEDN
jgi:hypothetical protein